MTRRRQDHHGWAAAQRTEDSWLGEADTHRHTANLTFQWQRELKDKFREQFEIVRGDVLRANYGTNPWMDKDQVITSISWISRIEDARDSLLRSNWT